MAMTPTSSRRRCFSAQPALNRERSEVVVQPGDSKDVFLTPHSPGTYDLRCSDHDWAGMVGGIVVR